MSNYTQSTNFATKDALPSGDPLKIVKGTEINTEFVNISTAIATKADLISPTFTGTPAAPTASAGDNSTQIATTAFVTAALQAAYPVGSVYINAGVTTNPATLLGFGTWTAFGAGRVMVGLNGSDALFDALEETGGSKDSTVVSHTHTYSGTTSTIGDHQHVSPDGQQFITTTPGGIYGGGGSSLYPSGSNLTQGAGSHNHTFSGTTASSGSSGTNANLQPYITVAMWKRTA